MADMFDAIDVIYGWLKTSKITAFKDKAPNKTELKSFVVINCPTERNLQRINKIPVNVNIYTKKNTNGMISRAEIKVLKQKVIESINNGTSPGYLFDITLSNSFQDTVYSKEYDILVLRYDLNISADI